MTEEIVLSKTPVFDPKSPPKQHFRPQNTESVKFIRQKYEHLHMLSSFERHINSVFKRPSRQKLNT